ncbi:ABC transporter permease [Virgibacillus necropolis]|uniref:ABC transporter permease n=1 Tax=Virgibacillus necropolis TaxID=163877 RepID=UPI0013747152|nr:ABC transporter permease [Virgibacillus necropolis]
MIRQIVKKQALIFLRNPQLLLLLIGLPIILIAILGASIGDLMNGETVSIDAKVAIIEHGSEQEQVENFILDVEKSKLSNEVKTAIQGNTEQLSLIETLIEDVLGSNELEEIITLESIKPSEKNEIINDDSFAAIIEVPENFTFNTLQHTMLGKGEPGMLKVYKNEGKQIGSMVVGGILEQFQEQLTMISFAGKHSISMEAIQVDSEAVSGEVRSINQKKPITAQNYYAVGMAVMNVLFVASMIGSFAFQEKKIHVFNRVILANLSRWIYFSGIFLSGVIFGFLHLLIVYGVSWLFFGITWPNLLGFFVVTFGLAIAVGGLAVLLTAISYRINSEVITNYFSSIVVSIIAFLGGSFFPIGDFSKTIQFIGNLTPNGAGMTAYLTLLRGDGISEILDQFFFLTLFAFLLVVIAGFSFPKRGYTL